MTRRRTRTNELPASGRTMWLGLLLIEAAVVWVFWPALDGEYLWDDLDQFANVPAVNDPSGLPKLWLSPTWTAQYYPVSLTAFWILRQTAGDWTPAYHTVNLVLHMANVALLLMLFRRFAPPVAALFGAGVFALHPVLVPAVAWMCQLRNCLSLHFALWAVWWWGTYEQSRSRRAYWIALGMFTLAMFSKTAVAPLPMVLWLAGTWAAPRKGRLIELLPLFAISLLLGLITVVYEAVGGASGPVFEASLPERLARMGWIGWFHLRQALLPLETAFVYPRWSIDASRISAYVPLVAGVAFFFAVIAWDRRARTGLSICLLAYAAMLFPVLGLFNVVFMQYAWVADHWQYPAMPALAAALVIVLARWHRAAGGVPRVALLGLTAVLAIAAVRARDRASLYQRMDLLWEDTLTKNPDGWLPNNNYGVLLEQQSQWQRAEQLYRRALAADPNNPQSMVNLARLYRKRGDRREAERLLRQALAAHPKAGDVRLSLVSLLIETGRFQDAVIEARRVVRDFPDYAPAHHNLATALRSVGKRDEAIVHYYRAIELQPDLWPARRALAALLIDAGRPQAAIEQLMIVAQSNEDATVWFGLGVAYAAMKRYDEAIAAYGRALELRPRWAAAANNLATTYLSRPAASKSDVHEALRWAKLACDTTEYADAGMLSTLARCLQADGQVNEARRILKEAHQLAIRQQQPKLAQSIARQMDELAVDSTTAPAANPAMPRDK